MHRPKHPFWVVTGLNKSLQHIGFIVLDDIGTELAKTKNNLKGMQGLGYGCGFGTSTYHIRPVHIKTIPYHTKTKQITTYKHIFYFLTDP